MKQRLFIIAALFLFGFSQKVAIVFAVPPDAGQLMREQQPQRQIPQQLPHIEKEIEKPLFPDSGVRVEVRAFRFTGYEGIMTERELQAVVADAVGKSLTLTELQGLAVKITAILKSKGWFLARAYLPAQDVTSGVIEIAIIQGKSDGSLTIKRDSSARISEQRLRAIARSAVQPGLPLNEQALERSVLLMNDLPGVTAKASLASGATPGSTGVDIAVSEGPLFSGAIWSDNQGNRYTGAWRGNGMINVNDPFLYGDQFSMMLTGAEGLTQGRASYLFPITVTGLKGNLAYTGMHYDLIGDLASLKSAGESHTIDAGISYPLLRSRIVNLTGSLGYQYKTLTDSAGNTDTRNRVLHSGTIGFAGDRYDTLLGGGYTTWNAGVTTGNMHEAIADISITKTEGAYTRFNFGMSRLQRLTERVSLNLSYSGQLSLDNLDSSEKFNLGGPNGIRAYPIGEGSGDHGHLFNVDLRYDLPLPPALGFLQLNGFYDAGLVKLHNETWANSVSTATNKNDYWLQGGGLGVTYSYGGKFSLKSSWAHVIGDNPGRSAATANDPGNKDADGRSDENRFWFQAMLFF